MTELPTPPSASPSRGADTRPPRRALAGATAAPGPQPRRERPLWLQVLANLAVALVLVSLVQAFLVRVHAVSSGSMEQTLAVTDRVVSSRLPYLSTTPRRGDIVIFRHGDTWDTTIRTPDPNPLKQALRQVGNLTSIGPSDYLYTVKRVVGIGGDAVACCDSAGRVQINGVASNEPYVFEDLPFTPGTIDCTSTPRSQRCFPRIVVPAGELLVMGDHRANSADSVYACRGETAALGCARFVAFDQVSGQVIGRLWPPGPVG